MEEDLKPIFDFKPLRDFLIDKGYVVGLAQGYREIRPEEVTVAAINRGEIDFTEDGIYVIGPGEERQQVYLYKRDYHLYDFGKPRFHICKCQIIDDFINRGMFREHYVRANSDPVPVKNLDNENMEEMVDELPICKYCLSKINRYGSINSSEFVGILRQVRGHETIEKVYEVDIFGYTRDWEAISREYRESHNYTCEECGLSIDNIFDRQYMHVHHIDANKLNNHESNLRCLCLRCHSNVDDVHRQNLRTGANKIVWEAFNETYPESKEYGSKIVVNNLNVFGNAKIDTLIERQINKE
ncbi:MAG: hypothetical protein Q4A15_07400 [Prevotellaceae bacterium]|nr:hypothetical protein [Prevotellaceae bacterium]